MLYVKVEHDGNPGKVKVTVATPFDDQPLWQQEIGPGETAEKKLTDLATGSQSWYYVRLDWDRNDYHNISSDGGMQIAFAEPINDANNNVMGMQVLGYGCGANTPVILR